MPRWSLECLGCVKKAVAGLKCEVCGKLPAMVSRVSLVPKVVVMAVSGTTTLELMSVSEDKRTRTLLEVTASFPTPSSSALCDGTSKSILQQVS